MTQHETTKDATLDPQCDGDDRCCCDACWLIAELDLAASTRGPQTPSVPDQDGLASNHTDVIVAPSDEDRDVALIEPIFPLRSVLDVLPEPASTQDENGALPGARWLADLEAPVVAPSRHDRTCRARATVLAVRAAQLGTTPGLALLPLYETLKPGARSPGRHLAVRTLAVTMASTYLRTHGGDGTVLAVVDGELRDPDTVALDGAIDAIAWSSDGRFVFDVLSVAKRPGQVRSDSVAGRPRRCVALAERLAAAEGATSVVRILAPGLSEPTIVAEVTS